MAMVRYGALFDPAYDLGSGFSEPQLAIASLLHEEWFVGWFGVRDGRNLVVSLGRHSHRDDASYMDAMYTITLAKEMMHLEAAYRADASGTQQSWHYSDPQSIPNLTRSLNDMHASGNVILDVYITDPAAYLEKRVLPHAKKTKE